MKVFLGFVFLLGVTALSLAISRLSNEAVALASGVVLGVVACLPVAVIIAVLFFLHRPAQQSASPAQFQPPVVVIYPPTPSAQAGGGRHDMGLHLLELENEQLRHVERARTWSGVNQQEPRQYRIRPIEESGYESSYDVDGEVW